MRRLLKSWLASTALNANLANAARYNWHVFWRWLVTGCFYDGGNNKGKNVFLNTDSVGGFNQPGDKALCKKSQSTSSLDAVSDIFCPLLGRTRIEFKRTA